MFIQFQLSSQALLHSKESFEETVSWRKLFERLDDFIALLLTERRFVCCGSLG
jgi:hypothetical protein